MQIGRYKNRTETDALIYLSQVFGVKSVKDLAKKPEIIKIIEENASDGYILDILVYNKLAKYLAKYGKDKAPCLMAKWAPILGFGLGAVKSKVRNYA